jgi:hypothetical protein
MIWQQQPLPPEHYFLLFSFVFYPEPVEALFVQSPLTCAQDQVLLQNHLHRLSLQPIGRILAVKIALRHALMIAQLSEWDLYMRILFQN